MGNSTFSPYDPSDYLKDASDMAAYLRAVIEQSGEDPHQLAQALGVAARADGLNELARETGLSKSEIANALSGEDDPLFSIVLKITKALGLRLAFRPAAEDQQHLASVPGSEKGA